MLNLLSVSTPVIPTWGHTFPNPPLLAHTPPKLIRDIHSRPPSRPLPVSVETLDVPHSPRAHMPHTARSTISHLFDPLIQSSLQLRHTTPLPYGSPLDLHSFRVARVAAGRCAGRGGDPKPVRAAAVGGVARAAIRDGCGAHRQPVVGGGAGAIAIRLPCESKPCGRQSGSMQATVFILEGCRVAMQGTLAQPDLSSFLP